jgi:hypothetical protein
MRWQQIEQLLAARAAAKTMSGAIAIANVVESMVMMLLPRNL